MERWKTIIAWMGLLSLFTCGAPSEPPAFSFYHWQSYWDVTVGESAYLDSLGVSRLYVRYFDVDVQGGGIVPVGKLLDKVEYRYPREVVPCVFITNRALQQVAKSGAGLDDLVAKVVHLITLVHPKVGSHDIQEVHFDADWTDGTRKIYFDFLKKIQKRKKAWKVSATIRLHQVKYHGRTGVPPTSGRNVLMCYNTGELDNPAETNSILNPQVVEQYIDDLSDYPADLDLALPLFSWAVLMREGKVIKLIRDVDAGVFEGKPQFRRQGNLVEVLQGTYLKAHYLYEGDRLRLEGPSRAKLLQTARLLQQNGMSPQRIIFYHLDSTIVKKYPHEELENIARQFAY